MENTKSLEQNKQLVIENLRQVHPNDSQIIDLLLLLLDDWVIRSEVIKCQNYRNKEDQDGRNQTVTQTVTKNVERENK